ncbi:MAG: copper chaperone PCu(A)C [Chloroflexota bacterium]
MRRASYLLTVLLAVLVVGCTRVESGRLFVENVWARPSPQGAPAGAFYMTIVNQTAQPDVLHDVSIENCEAVEIHRTTMDEEGVMRMAPVDEGRLSIPAGEEVVLAPGGLHVMCIGLGEPLAAGERLPLTLHFEVAGDVTASADIRQEAP